MDTSSAGGAVYKLRPLAPAEGVRLNELDRGQAPYLCWRDDKGELRVTLLERSLARAGVGRHPESEVPVPFDDEASRAHAELLQTSGEWAIEDDGLSLNGTFVNGARVVARRRLAHGDQVLVGQTLIEFRDPRGTALGQTRKGRGSTGLDLLSPAHRKVLAALCAPLRDGAPGTPVPSNRELAEVLVLSDETIKSHLQAMYERLEIQGSTRNRRARLAQMGLEWGADLASP